jgi:hypothetical protein
MSSTLLIIWLVIAVISVTYFFVSNANSEPEEDEGEGEGEESEYPAVRIVFSESDACSAVRKFAGQRLLSSEAPLLPLADCTQRECTCTYHHFEDRRLGSRRVDETSVVKRCYDGSEKRVAQRGRRAEDAMEDTFEQEVEAFETHADTYYDYVDRTGLMKAMAKKEAEDLAADSSDQGSSEQGSSDQGSSDQAPLDQAPLDQEKIAPFTPPSSNEHLPPASSAQKKSGQSRS